MPKPKAVLTSLVLVISSTFGAASADTYPNGASDFTWNPYYCSVTYCPDIEDEEVPTYCLADPTSSICGILYPRCLTDGTPRAYNNGQLTAFADRVICNQYPINK